MTTTGVALARPPHKATFFGVCLVLELLAFSILPLSSQVSLPLPVLLSFQTGLAACLLAAAIASRRLPTARPYSRVLYALFGGSAGLLLAALLGGRTLAALSLANVSPAWIALSRLSDVAWLTVGIVVLMAAGGAGPRSMYLTRGRVGLGVGLGLAGFAAFAMLAFARLPVEQSGRKLLLLTPWILTFALANGFGQELLFRGLLLPRLEPVLGKGWSNLLAAVAYTVLHAPAAANAAVFLLMLFPLALAWGGLMQKSRSVWGSALFHAGADCFVVLALNGSP